MKKFNSEPDVEKKFGLVKKDKELFLGILQQYQIDFILRDHSLLKWGDEGLKEATFYEAEDNDQKMALMFHDEWLLNLAEPDLKKAFLKTNKQEFLQKLSTRIAPTEGSITKRPLSRA